MLLVVLRSPGLISFGLIADTVPEHITNTNIKQMLKHFVSSFSSQTLLNYFNFFGCQTVLSHTLITEYQNYLHYCI